MTERRLEVRVQTLEVDDILESMVGALDGRRRVWTAELNELQERLSQMERNWKDVRARKEDYYRELAERYRFYGKRFLAGTQEHGRRLGEMLVLETESRELAKAEAVFMANLELLGFKSPTEKSDPDWSWIDDKVTFLTWFSSPLSRPAILSTLTSDPDSPSADCNEQRWSRWRERATEIVTAQSGTDPEG
jgi:hypothetical protein